MRYLENQRGAILILFAFLLPVLIGFLIFVSDISMIKIAKVSLNNVAESAAHSAVNKGFDKEEFRNTGLSRINISEAKKTAEDIVEEHKKTKTRPYVNKVKDVLLSNNGKNLTAIVEADYQTVLLHRFADGVPGLTQSGKFHIQGEGTVIIARKGGTRQ